MIYGCFRLSCPIAAVAAVPNNDGDLAITDEINNGARPKTASPRFAWLGNDSPTVAIAEIVSDLTRQCYRGAVMTNPSAIFPSEIATTTTARGRPDQRSRKRHTDPARGTPAFENSAAVFSIAPITVPGASTVAVLSHHASSQLPNRPPAHRNGPLACSPERTRCRFSQFSRGRFSGCTSNRDGRPAAFAGFAARNSSNYRGGKQ